MKLRSRGTVSSLYSYIIWVRLLRELLHEPLSVVELHKRTGINKTSIYRYLDLGIKNGFIKVTAFELAKKNRYKIYSFYPEVLEDLVYEEGGL